jgi:hypothetical protein
MRLKGNFRAYGLSSTSHALSKSDRRIGEETVLGLAAPACTSNLFDYVALSLVYAPRIHHT